jgi:hypothetical protein
MCVYIYNSFYHFCAQVSKRFNYYAYSFFTSEITVCNFRIIVYY